MTSTLRPALYYPYIHIRSESWLKATLLCAPTVKRIVPPDYQPDDDLAILKYSDIKGPWGTLLQTVPTTSQAAQGAQRFLLAKLRAYSAEIKARYHRKMAPAVDVYRIHPAKFSDDLVEHLLSEGLAWPSPHRNGFRSAAWYALHPVLGSAVMTVLGLSIAGEQKYDVVTPNADFHEMLLTNRQEDVIERLLSIGEPTPTPTSKQARNDLGQLVIAMTGVNFRALRPEDIPELQASRHFEEFQQLLKTSTRLVARDEGQEQYRRELKHQAEEIIEAWQQTRGVLSKGLREVLFASTMPLAGDAMASLMERDGSVGLATGAGMAIVLVAHERSVLGGPYKFLTQVQKAENECLRMTYPLGLEP